MKKVLVAVVVACGFAAFANEWYIDAENGDDTAAGTEQAPRKTLKGAMEIPELAANDTVWLLPGDYNVGEMPYFDASVSGMTYASTNRCFITKPGLKIRSTGGKDVTFVTGAKDERVSYTKAYGGVRCFLIAAEATGVIIEGLTIQTGYAPYVQKTPYWCGGGVLDLSKNCWVIDCKISGGQSARGGGQTYGNALRTEYLNTAASGRGSAAQDVNMLVNCVIRNGNGVAPVDGSTPTLVNCLITATASQYGISQDAKITAYNSIFVGNTKGGNGTKQKATFSNCVVGPFIVGAYTNDNVTCVSCVTNATVDDVAWANSTTSPYDWRIASTSVARGVGDTAILATIQEQLPEGYSVYTDLYGTLIPEEGKIAAGPVQPVNWYVDAANGNDDDHGGRTLAAAFKTIRKATSVAYDGDTIRVAPGVYGEAEGTQLGNSKAVVPIRVILPENITLESLEGAEKTFIVGKGPDTPDDDYGLTGTGSVKCVYAKAGSVIRGFTITGGHTCKIKTGVDADLNYSAIQGVSRTSGTVIEDCIISNNVANSYTINYVTLRNSKILNNATYEYGSAGYYCKYEGCLFDGNRGGRQIYQADAPIVNCTIGTKNYADMTGSSATTVFGYSVAGSGMKLVNTLWAAGKQWVSTTAAKPALQTVATNCVIQSGVVGAAGGIPFANCVNCYTNITANLTKSVIDANYRLRENSPAIDAGTNDLVNLARDLDGNPRISNGTVDIGAYEYDWRGRYKEDLGPRATAVTAASPMVVETEDGTVRIPSGTLAGKFKLSGGTTMLNFKVQGGKLTVYVGEKRVGEFGAADAKQSVELASDESDEFRLVFTPSAADGYAEIDRLTKGTSGIIFMVR